MSIKPPALCQFTIDYIALGHGNVVLRSGAWKLELLCNSVGTQSWRASIQGDSLAGPVLHEVPSNALQELSVCVNVRRTQILSDLKDARSAVTNLEDLNKVYTSLL